MKASMLGMAAAPFGDAPAAAVELGMLRLEPLSAVAFQVQWRHVNSPAALNYA
ncbi:hypothetical protein [Paenibacillus taihuensis]|uniref:hypothetical protein n=1 Tax=Paenibacillus taihuensis TaxID=1156355 RepID=UPI0015F261E9|nr:hypothetical protein [Paenibacillus taihuensis]